MTPYLFSEFYQNKKVPLATMIKLTSKNQAKRYGLFPRKGSMQIGTDADFTVIDLKRPFQVDESKLHSLGKYSPFNGNTFNCSIDKTIVRGDIVFDCQKGFLQKPGWGKFVRRT
jgi:dihydroorotase-like cyclic amidohydrolase